MAGETADAVTSSDPVTSSGPMASPDALDVQGSGGSVGSAGSVDAPDVPDAPGSGGSPDAPGSVEGVEAAGGGAVGPGAARRARRGRRGRWLAALAVLVAGGVAAQSWFGLVGRDGGGGDDGADDRLPPKSVRVDRRDLKDSRTEDGSLGFGTSRTAVARTAGTLTDAPRAGSTLRRGQTLYEVDGAPVVLLYGAKPAYRALREGVEGEDVRQLEKNLAALGYDGFTVDDEFSDRTAAAVKEWQEDLGTEETGRVDLGRVVFAPGRVRVDAVEAEEGAALTPGAQVLAYTGTDKVVTVEIDPEHQGRAKKGTEVGVVLPDGRTVRGEVDGVTTVITPGEGNEDAETTAEVLVSLTGAGARRAADRYVLAAVDVEFTAGTRKDVLTVPVAALLALAEGGFGVEVVTGDTTRYVPVETGLFADGRVEISGGGISESTRVGVPE
ncbi:efflux RND transporter periplasmic adaptor subunit [Streptomyces sp. JNUCC 64]